MRANEFPYWQSILDQIKEFQWEWRDSVVYVSLKIPNDPRKLAYSDAGGCNQSERSSNPMESGFYDLPFYKSALSILLKDDVPELAVDLGCGDGRLTELLLAADVEHVIALDFNENDVNSIVRGLRDDQRQRVLPVCAPVNTPPLIRGCADIAIMSEVAYTLDDPLKAYQYCNDWLRPGGRALVSNVAAQAYFVHALLNGDLEQAHRVASQGSYLETVAGGANNNVMVTLYDAALMDRHAEASGFSVVERIVVPASAALMIHAARKYGSSMPDNFDEILPEVQEMTPSIDRIYIDILEKK